MNIVGLDTFYENVSDMERYTRDIKVDNRAQVVTWYRLIINLQLFM